MLCTADLVGYKALVLLKSNKNMQPQASNVDKNLVLAANMGYSFAVSPCRQSRLALYPIRFTIHNSRQVTMHSLHDNGITNFSFTATARPVTAANRPHSSVFY
jgi:hypothetical protein